MAGNKLTRTALDRVYRAVLGKAAPEAYMIGIRGAVPVTAGGNEYKLTDDKPFINNDALGIVWADTVKLYKGTVDPGRYYTEHPSHGGCFHLGDGLFTAGRGLHGLTSKKPYPAFRIRNAKGWRDRDRNGLWSSGDFPATVADGINIHRGSSGDLIGKASAGCSNVIASQWDEFKQLGYEVLPDPFQYWVISGRRLADALASPNSRAVRVLVNRRPLPAGVDCWLQEGTTWIAVRDFLAHLLLDGKSVAFEYRPGPDRVIVAGQQIPLRILAGRGFAPLRDLVMTLDANAQLKWNATGPSVTVTSGHLVLQAPDAVPCKVVYDKDQDVADVVPE